jgi:hypothetical protein
MLAQSYNNNTKNKPSLSARTIVTVLVVAVPCFFVGMYAGTLSSLYTGVMKCPDRHIVLDGAGSISGVGGASGVQKASDATQNERIMSEADIKSRVAEQVRTLEIQMKASESTTVDRLVEERMQVLMRQHNVNCKPEAEAEAKSQTATVEALIEERMKVFKAAEYDTINRRVDERMKVLKATQTATVNGLVEERMLVEKESQAAAVDVLVKEQMKDLTKGLDAKCAPAGEHPAGQKAGEKEKPLFPVDRIGHFVSGMARTSKERFTEKLDLGVPLDKPINGSQDVLMIYSNNKSLPKAMLKTGTDVIPDLSFGQAMENCDYLNVLLTFHTFGREQCIAIVPQYESYHVQKWMRIDHAGRLDHARPMQKVSRGHQSNGRDQFDPPSMEDTHKNWDMLRLYLDSINNVLEDLKPIVEKIAVKNTVIVMVCNFGQAELLMNFVCSAKARGHDISNILVFATDQETLDLAESVGLTAYFDQRVRMI